MKTSSTYFFLVDSAVIQTDERSKVKRKRVSPFDEQDDRAVPWTSRWSFRTGSAILFATWLTASFSSRHQQLVRQILQTWSNERFLPFLGRSRWLHHHLRCQLQSGSPSLLSLIHTCWKYCSWLVDRWTNWLLSEQVVRRKRRYDASLHVASSRRLSRTTTTQTQVCHLSLASRSWKLWSSQKLPSEIKLSCLDTAKKSEISPDLIFNIFAVDQINSYVFLIICVDCVIVHFTLCILEVHCSLMLNHPNQDYYVALFPSSTGLQYEVKVMEWSTPKLHHGVLRPFYSNGLS